MCGWSWARYFLLRKLIMTEAVGTARYHIHYEVVTITHSLSSYYDGEA